MNCVSHQVQMEYENAGKMMVGLGTSSMRADWPTASPVAHIRNIKNLGSGDRIGVGVTSCDR